MDYGVVEDGGEGPDGNRTQVFQVPVGDAVGAGGASGGG